MKFFVYGTLKQGYGNHRRFGNNHRFLKKDSISKLALLDLGAFPAAIHHADEKQKIHGELYEIINNQEQVMASLDALEGHPNFYRRETMTTDSGEETYVYVIPNPLRYASYPVLENGVWPKE